MQKSWSYEEHTSTGPNVELIAQTEDCQVHRMQSESGEGFMTMYQLMDGVFVMFNDFHMETCVSHFETHGNMLRIDHVREGRYEMSLNDGSFLVYGVGDLCFKRFGDHTGDVSFPLKHYHGATVILDLEPASRSIAKALPGIPVDLDGIVERFTPEPRASVIHETAEIAQIFDSIYAASGPQKKTRLSLKVVELLVALQEMEELDWKNPNVYHTRDQTGTVKLIHRRLTEDLSCNYTIAELCEAYGIAATSLKSIFKSIYGSPIHTYLRNYRMNAAAVMLIEEPEKRIGEIARAVGYESAGKFSIAFREIMGESPQNYRNHQR